MKRQTITAIVPSGNESQNIKRCLSSLLWCDQIQVLFMGNDKTDEIAKELGAKVIKFDKAKYANIVGVQKAVNWAIDHSQTDWMLRIDADEVVTSAVQQEIQDLLHQSQKDLQSPVAYGIPRKQYFLGGFLKGGDWAYDRLVRLFKPENCRYEPIVSVHEQFKVNGKVGYLKNALLHYSHPDFKTLIKKFSFYTTLESQQIKDDFFASLLKMLFNPIYIFLRWFFYHHGYRDGIKGIFAGFARGSYDFLLYFKRLKYLLGKSQKSSGRDK